MQYRELGDMSVSVVGMGCNQLGVSCDLDGAVTLVDVAVAAGINSFDTADVYSDGLSETILGKAVAGRRADVLISTKATFRMGTGANDLGSSRPARCGGAVRSRKRSVGPLRLGQGEPNHRPTR